MSVSNVALVCAHHGDDVITALWSFSLSTTWVFTGPASRQLATAMHDAGDVFESRRAPADDVAKHATETVLIPTCETAVLSKPVDTTWEVGG